MRANPLLCSKSDAQPTSVPMSTFDPTQHPRGNTVTGHAGQFATKQQTGAEVSLGTTPRRTGLEMLKSEQLNRAERQLFNAAVFEEEDPDFPSIVRMRVSANHGDRKGFSGMLTNKLRWRSDAEANRRKLSGQQERKVTVLTAGRAGDIRIIEGRAMNLQGKDYLVLKGSKSKAYTVDQLDVIDVRDGYDADQMETIVRRTAETLPATRRADVEGIPLEGEPGTDNVNAVFVYNGPDFGDGPARGSIIYATDITPDGDDPIINGAFVFPPGTGLTSEHGSIRLSDLQRHGGRIDVPVQSPRTFADALRTGDDVTDGIANVSDLY